MAPPPLDPETTGTTRRTFLTRTAAGAAAGGLLWVAPAVLSVDAAAAASCGIGGAIDWSTQTVNTSPASVTSNGVLATITKTTNASAQADAFTVYDPLAPPAAPTPVPAAGNFGGQSAKYYRLSMKNAPNNAELDVQFDFTKSAAAIKVNNLTFTLFDIDGFSNLNWWDRIIIESVPVGAAFTTTKPGTTSVPTGSGTAASPLQGNGTVVDATNNGNATIAFTVPVSSVKIRYIESKATANNDNQYVGIGNLTWNGCT